MQRKQKKNKCGIDIGAPQMDTNFVVVSKKFHTRVDALANNGTWKVWNECYLGMHTSSTNYVLVCTRYAHEKGRHRFVTLNNIDPRKRLDELKNLT